MALADLAIASQQWIEDEFRDPGSDGVRFLRHLADETAGNARAAVPRRTSGTFDSISVDEVTGKDGIHYFRVLARRPQVDVLNSSTGYIRNPGPRTHELTRTGRRRSSTGRTVRPAEPFMREALAMLEVTKAGF